MDKNCHAFSQNLNRTLLSLLLLPIMVKSTGTNSPTSLTSQRVNSTSIKVMWTPPSSGPTVTGYRIYYQIDENQGRVKVGANITEYTITSAMTSRYIITLVAVSDSLPSAPLHLDFINSGKVLSYVVGSLIKIWVWLPRLQCHACTIHLT